VTTPGPVATATQRLAWAASTVPGLRVSTSVSAPITPPAVVVGPPKLVWRGYGSSGNEPTTGQWNVYLVVTMNQYASDALLALVGPVSAAIERFTPGVVISSAPGTYPSPTGALPAHVITVQLEVNMM
jgi:hypothetical protein